jgi:nucleoid DNA-binding protein
MTQSQITKIISRRTNITQNSVREVLRALTQFFNEAFEEDVPIRMAIGSFESKMRPPKPAYDFKMGKKITLPPATRIVYKPSTRIQQTLKAKDAQLAFDFLKRQTSTNDA